MAPSSRACHAAQRDALGVIHISAGVPGRVPGRVEAARGHYIYGDVVGTQLAGEDAGHPNEPHFGCVDVGPLGVSCLGAVARYVYDPAVALLDHRWYHCLC